MSRPHTVTAATPFCCAQVEPGQIAIPAIANLLKVPAIGYQAAAAGIVGWDIYTYVAGIEARPARLACARERTLL